MKRTGIVLLVLIALARPARAQTAFTPSLTSPSEGQALQGAVTITGTTAVDGYASSELSFAYSGDPTGTWFLISTTITNAPVFDDTLATWDTTTITDGDYALRLRVFLLDATFTDITVGGLRVRNYTPVETPTPAPTVEQSTPLPSATPTATPQPTPTPLPRNPAVLDPADLRASLGVGGLAVLLAFALLGIYLWLRRK
jgi:hypothetical protein